MTTTTPTVVTPQVPNGTASRLHWTVVDAWTMTQRDLAHWVRQPVPVLIGLFFPVMTVLMFGYLFGGGMTVPGGGNYREFLIPGMFAMTMVFGIETTFAAITLDASRGVTDRFRSMPISPSAVVAGRSVADMLSSVVGLLVMIGCGLTIGWRWHNGVADALLAVGLLLLLRFSLLWVSIYLALLAKSPEAIVAIQILVWPLGALSSAFVSPETMPSWLGTIVEWNPISATATATRDLFGNPGVGGGSWATEHPLLLATAWPLLLLTIFVPLSVRQYMRLRG